MKLKKVISSEMLNFGVEVLEKKRSFLLRLLSMLDLFQLISKVSMQLKTNSRETKNMVISCAKNQLGQESLMTLTIQS